MFDANKFDIAAFNTKLEANLLALQGAEKITKAVLMALSRDVLEALHTNEDIRPVNAVLNCLTPVNKKVAIAYFQQFLGFKYDDTKQQFTTKNKAAYDAKRVDSAAFLEDPLNNIWTWAERNVVIEAKQFDLEQVTEATKKFLKKAEKNNIEKGAVLKAILAAGIDIGTIMSVLDSLIDQKEQPILADPADAAQL